MGSKDNSKEVEKLVKQIRTWPGWRVEEGTKGYKVFPPDKSHPMIPVHHTPSGSRYIANKKSELKRAGAPL